MNGKKRLRLPAVLGLILTLLVGSTSPAYVRVAQATGTWTAAGNLVVGRWAHAAILLPSGKTLIAGGYGNGPSFLASAELYDPAAGTFSSTGSMGAARANHTATLLSNGKVLVTGGAGAGSSLASAELYDASSGTFAATGSMNAAREYHTATLLPDGKVLVAGGYASGGSFLASAELYDPASGTFSATGSMSAGREYHTATLLPNGKVLVAGGYAAGVSLPGAELYDPTAGTFSTTGSMNAARALHTATSLPTGLVLLAGGLAGNPLASAELYDPASGTFSATGGMAASRSQHTATLLPGGRVLIAGGVDSSFLASAEVYDPAAGSFAPDASMGVGRALHTATRLANGCILVAGGSGPSQASSELYKDSGCASVGPDLSITKVGVVSGQTVTYNIIVTNIGTVPAANPIQLTDSMPSAPTGVQFASFSGNCSGPLSGPIVCVDPNAPAQLAPSQSFTSTIALSVGTAGGIVTNCATVSQGSNAMIPADPDLSNNQACVTNTVPSAPVAACLPPPSGMVGWWPGDNNTNDKIGGNLGTLMNGATFTPGMVAAAFSLLGGSDYVNVPDSPQLNPDAGDFSVDAWIKTSAAAGTATFLDKRTVTVNPGGGSVVTGYGLYISQGRLGIQLADGGANGGWSNYQAAGPMIADGQWHHVAAMITRGSTTGGVLLIDGAVALTFNPTGRSGSLNNKADLRIGESHLSAGVPPVAGHHLDFQGLVDEVEFFKRALTPLELQDIYNAGSAGKCKPKSMPVIIGPQDGFVSVDLAPLLQWMNPDGTTQIQVQVTPYNNDGPGINLILNETTSYQVQAPIKGVGNYVMLPGMTYSWQVRSTQATVAVDENDPGWSAWAEPVFITAPPSSAGIRLVSPAEGSTIFDRWGTLVWDDTDIVHFYYEVQVSEDPSFNTDPNTATAMVYWELRHGGVTDPLNSYTIPANFPLTQGREYHWRVRPRVQGDGTPVAWSAVYTFKVADNESPRPIDR